MGIYYGFACDDLNECIGGHDKNAYLVLTSRVRSVLAWLMGPEFGDYGGRWSGRTVRSVADSSFDFDLNPGWVDIELEALRDIKTDLELRDRVWETSGLLEHELSLAHGREEPVAREKYETLVKSWSTLPYCPKHGSTEGVHPAEEYREGRTYLCVLCWHVWDEEKICEEKT
jgi:hypothetical protein